MKQGTLAAVLGGAIMLSVGAPALASALGDDDPSETASPIATSLSLVPGHTQSNDADDEATDDAANGARETTLGADENKADKPETAKVEKPDKGQGHGPPSWAHATGDGGKGSLDAWKELTPRQRAKKMAVLTRAHTAGMKKWAKCTAAGRNDCVRPLPPGLAKRG
jgi:hypothetical protein